VSEALPAAREGTSAGRSQLHPRNMSSGSVNVCPNSVGGISGGGLVSGQHSVSFRLDGGSGAAYESPPATFLAFMQTNGHDTDQLDQKAVPDGDGQRSTSHRSSSCNIICTMSATMAADGSGSVPSDQISTVAGGRRHLVKASGDNGWPSRVCFVIYLDAQCYHLNPNNQVMYRHSVQMYFQTLATLYCCHNIVVS
jgi:hypothetical protein